MACSIDIRGVAVLSSKKEEIESASGENSIRLVLRDFARNGKGKVLVFSSPANEKVSLAMSLGGDLQIECP